MIASISQAKIEKQATDIPAKITRTSIFYINDVHSNLTNIERLKTASDDFDNFTPSNKEDKLKFSAGDFALGKNIKLNELAVKAQNSMGLMATAGGNHEFDLLKKDLTKVLNENNYKILGLNVKIPETTKENKILKNEVTKSYIQEQDGNKYGVIGLLPFDFIAHISNKKEYSDFKILTMKETIPLIQKEINNLKKQGVNKIILLSHSGYSDDVKLAQTVEGIDVIIGGHTHTLIEGIKEGKNLFYSKKTGEPTIITQIGKNGERFGVLNLEFNNKGVITKAQNNVTKTKTFSKSPIIEYFVNKILGKPKIIGEINSASTQETTLTSENPSADFINDAVRNELDVDFAIMNSANMRESFKKGRLTDRTLSEMTPFKNKMCIIQLSEQRLVNAIKNGAKSFTNKNNMPGLLQVSGIKYTVNKSGDVKSIHFIDKNGKYKSIDLNYPNPFKMYRVAADSFVVSGGNGYIPNMIDKTETKFDFDKDKLVIDYIKKIKTPINIKSDGRIKIID